MKRQIFSVLVAGTILSTGAFAFGGNSGNCQQMGAKHMKMRGHQKRDGIMNIVRELNLTDSQRQKLDKLRKENRKNMVKLSDAFSGSKFNKSKYEKLLQQRRDSRIKNQANMIEDIFSVLTAKQKAQFVTLLELHEEKMANPPMPPRKMGK